MDAGNSAGEIGVVRTRRIDRRWGREGDVRFDAMGERTRGRIKSERLHLRRSIQILYGVIVSSDSWRQRIRITSGSSTGPDSQKSPLILVDSQRIKNQNSIVRIRIRPPAVQALSRRDT